MAKQPKPWIKYVIYSLLFLYAAVTMVPFLWALSSSFKTLEEIVAGGISFIPKHFTLQNYYDIFVREPLFTRWMFNSALIAVVATVCNILFNSMAGYALARIDFIGNKVMFLIILGVQMIPGQLTIVPAYLIMKELGWLNSYAALTVPMMANATFTFMMRQFFINFPKELEEASQLDGLSRFGIFFRIALPLAVPALAAQMIFVFMGAWNEFLKPLMFVSDKSMFTLTLGLNTFKGQYISYWNYIMAASMVFTLPALLIYAFFNRFFIKGITFTGGK
ncbi:carbohydrate ABC transporter membrane protein 2, CUT1 family (TC 3.A.1.1.-) [Paenibacillus tianmuensis]|uniref:Carbohydrate ABC transporter membrane protein 2, CUT1 family (TC 3.A.1.1.-) n=1 Tax=Paenibacillus tianmuensis TaxID=624147 RepID=A0A1G4SMN6_9BACL|nr:carbohydrate ABC transporter permease [Paenibacillus tianmuensis]SCW69559.1 carbohydrate ABC transporter membrane protein 2, CUT1 family (TC 3.A.1.1.-) [Paenibacillus tianmuensis]